MNKKTRKIVLFIFSIILLISSTGGYNTSVGAEMNNIDYSDVKWEFNTQTGTLLISGTGDMPGYFECCNDTPWYKYIDRISTLIIEDEVTSIGNYAFSECEHLKKVIIGEGVTSIDNEAFSGCTSLTNIEIGSNVKHISYSAFYNTAYYNNKDNWEKGVLYISKYLIIANSDILEEYIIKDGTTVIAEDAFYDTKIKSIIVPDSVISINDSAFGECENLTDVKLGNGLTSINSETFYKCSKLETINIPDSVGSIGYKAFSDCKNLTKIVIPNSVLNIGMFAFRNCTQLNDIEISDNIEIIREGAFRGTAYYENEENWDNNVLYISNSLIESKKTISDSYAIKRGTKLIADAAFKNCKNLEDIIIPDSIINIGAYAFSGCTNLINISMGSGITNIRDSAFEWCIGLTNIVIPSSVKSIESAAFYECYNLEGNITIPKNVTYIGYGALGICTDSADITILNPECNIEDGEYTIYCETIYGYNGSTAEAYAQKFNKKFIAINEEEKTTLGEITTKNEDTTIVEESTMAVEETSTEISTTEQQNTTGTEYSTEQLQNTTTTESTTEQVQNITANQTTKDNTTKAETVNNKTTKVKKLLSKKRALKVSWKKAIGIKGYQIQYSQKKNFKKAKTIIIKKESKTSTVVKKLESGKKYFVRIRTYFLSDGKKVYSAWSKTKTKKIK